MIYYVMGLILLVIAILVFYIYTHQSIWDQIVAMNVITNMVVLLILLFTLLETSTVTVDSAIVFSLLSFIGSLFIIIFVYRRGDIS